MRGEKYSLSGKPGLALLVVPVVGVATALILGIAYSYLSIYIPLAGYVTVILLGGFGFAGGLVLSTAGEKARCRSTLFMGMCGLVFGAFAIYVAWATFEHVLIEKAGEESPGIFALMLQPGVMWEIAKSVNETGWFSIGGGTPSGVFLWILWAIEALVVIGAFALLAPAGISGEVFCEKCGKWLLGEDKPARLSVTEDEALLKRVSAGDLDAMASLGAAADHHNLISSSTSAHATAAPPPPPSRSTSSTTRSTTRVRLKPRMTTFRAVDHRRCRRESVARIGRARAGVVAGRGGGRRSSGRRLRQCGRRRWFQRSAAGAAAAAAGR